MQKAPLILAAALVCGGVGGWIGTSFFGGPPEVASDSASAPLLAAIDNSDDFNALARELQGMHARLDGMQDDLGRRQQVIVPAPATETAGPSNATYSGPAIDTVYLRDQLDQLLDERQEERDKERQDRDAQRTKDRISRQIDRLTEELGLDSIQAQELQRILTEQTEKTRQAMQEMRDAGEGWDVIREEMQKYRDEANSQIQTVLLPDQYEGYQDSSASRRFGGWGRGDSGGGNNNSGRGGRGRDGGRSPF